MINKLIISRLCIVFSWCSGLEVEKSRVQSQASVEDYASLDAFSAVEEMRRHRFSALVDGICVGVGVVFILLGVLMPISSVGMLVQGLMSVIGGLVVLVVGLVVEVYHWARLR